MKIRICYGIWGILYFFFWINVVEIFIRENEVEGRENDILWKLISICRWFEMNDFGEGYVNSIVLRWFYGNFMEICVIFLLLLCNWVELNLFWCIELV